MKKYIVLLLISVSFYTCQVSEQPKELLSKEKMAKILIGIHLAEAKSNFYQYKTVDSNKLLFRTYKDDLFKKEGISSVTFDSSFNYYSKDVKTFNKIYSAVIDSLMIKEAMNKVD